VTIPTIDQVRRYHDSGFQVIRILMVDNRELRRVRDINDRMLDEPDLSGGGEKNQSTFMLQILYSLGYFLAQHFVRGWR
jgi:hypothetical protein